jgi:RHS repeat-associated protein
VYAQWTQHANRATDATYTVTHAGGSTPVAVNQQANGGVWNLLGIFSLSPGPAHNVTLTDLANGYVIADAIRLVPVAIQAEQKLHFVHTDHLNTPRLVADATGTTVWRNYNTEPFGDSVPDENPSGLGAFEFPLGLGGYQYRDKETDRWNTWFRSYAAMFGRFDQFDLIGLRGGINGYVYVSNNPLRLTDPYGLLGVDPIIQERGLRELGKKAGKQGLIKPQVKEIALRCANELPCGILNPGGLGVGYYALDKCRTYVDNSPLVPPAEKGGATDDCLGECIRLIKEKCKANPNACAPGDDSGA